jgi:hypothetical protein
MSLAQQFQQFHPGEQNQAQRDFAIFGGEWHTKPQKSCNPCHSMQPQVFRMLNQNLAGGLEHVCLFFPSYWECHHPNFHILGIPPTRYVLNKMIQMHRWWQLHPLL